MATVDPRTLFQQRLRERIDSRGTTMHALSKAIGANPGYVRDLLDEEKNTRPTSDKLAAIARELDTTTDYLLGRADSARQVRSEVDLLQDPRPQWSGPAPDLPPIPLVGTGDCADLEIEDEGGHMVKVERSTFDPEYTVRFIRRPPALAGARDIYAIEFRGESMVRRFEPGDIGVVDPGRPVHGGDYVLVQLRASKGSNEVGSVLAKRLVRQNAHEYVLEQFNPELVFILPKEQVVRIHRIMRPNDLLF